MDYAEALDYLKRIQPESEKLALETIQAIVDRFPFSLAGTRFIQVAGTNGKGSTTHFLAEILRRSGFRTGRFTSPHLSDVRERIAVDGRIIPRADFAAAVSFVHDHCRRLIAAGVIATRPTFFETVFLAALYHFRRRRVAWAVLEVGLGGRLDATSTIRPEAAVITNISRDHVQILGRTLKSIAAEKAGIIKPGVPVVCGCPVRSRAAQEIRRRARERGAEYHPVLLRPGDLEVDDGSPVTRCRYHDGHRWHDLRIGLQGRHQAGNAAVAVKTAMVLRAAGVPIPAAAVRSAIRRATIPARIESIPGRPPAIVDGGHNAAGARALGEWLERRGIRGATLLFGVLADKEYRAMAACLRPFAARVILTRPGSHRALDPETLRPLFRGLPCRVVSQPTEALALAKSYPSLIIVTGSLYLAGELRPMLARRPRRGR